MLNKSLFLNQDVFSDKVEKKTTRAGFGSGLVKAGEANKNVVALTADLRDSVNTTEFAKKFPDRFFDCGVAEQGMVTIASGLAVSGKIPFATSYAVFSPGRNWEQIRTTIAYNNVPVKIVGGHAGLLTSPDGATHQALEDIALMRSLPNMKVIAPCDFYEAEKAVLAMAKDAKPNYLRLNRPELPLVTTEKTPFEIGKAQVFWLPSGSPGRSGSTSLTTLNRSRMGRGNKKPQATIIACGEMVYYSLLAALDLEQKKIEVEVINLSTIKPLDKKTILESVKKTNKVVTVEDHQVAGGMGSAIAEFLAANYPVKIKFLGVHDSFGESGVLEELLGKHGLLAKDIATAVESFVK